jgi:hypothetical protein
VVPGGRCDSGSGRRSRRHDCLGDGRPLPSVAADRGAGGHGRDLCFSSRGTRADGSGCRDYCGRGSNVLPHRWSRSVLARVQGVTGLPRAIAAAILWIATVALVLATLVEEGDLCHQSGLDAVVMDRRGVPSGGRDVCLATPASCRQGHGWCCRWRACRWRLPASCLCSGSALVRRDGPMVDLIM